VANNLIPISHKVESAAILLSDLLEFADEMDEIYVVYSLKDKHMGTAQMGSMQGLALAIQLLTLMCQSNLHETGHEHPELPGA